MAKIPKNLTDKAMFNGYKEQETFETMFLADEPVKPKPKIKGEKKETLDTAFLTQELQEKIGKLLLEVKLDLYKEGVVDYTVKAAREGNRIVLTPVEVKKK